MTDLSQKKADIKKNIRSLLLSSPAALTPKELKSDYHGFIGEPIDFRMLGYVSFEDFLRDLDDVVSIGFKNGMMTLSAKADETTKHIQKLVSKQKVPNKKKYAVYRQRGGYSGPPHRYQMPDRSRYPPRRQYQQLVPPQPVVPAFVRRQIGELFRSFPDGVEVIYLEKAFMRVFGTGLNYQHYGFMNQYEFLQSMGDIIKVEEVRKGEWYVLPIEYKKKPEPLMSIQVAPPKTSPTSPVQLDSQETIRKLNNNSDTTPSKTNRASKGRGRRRFQSGDKDTSGTQEVPSVGIISNSTPAEESLEGEVQAILERHSNGLWASSFAREYQAFHGKPIIYKNLGHLSVVDLVASMPHIVTIRRPNPQGDWMLYDARSAPSQESSTSRSRHSSGKAVETNIKDAIKDILYCHPNGVNIKNLPKLYKEYTSKDLPFEELGFNTAEDLFVSLADNYLQLSYSTSGIMLYPMNHDKLSPTTNDVDIEQQISDDDQQQHQQQQHGIPQDVVGPGCHFIPVMLPDADQYIELYVTNIVSPGLFWIMLRHKTKSLALEELMDKLDEAYRHNSDVYTMPESLMVPGQVCAALFPEDNNWHRGVITGSNDEGFIKCYYVDYGNTNFVTKSHIRFLKTEFLTLPAQAVQARLANTQPPAPGKWKNKSKTRLLELTSHRPLVAYVFEVKDQKMSICLTDTSDPQVDIHINDVMVNEGLAQFIPDNESTAVNTTTHALEPDYSQVFGWNAVEVPRLPKVIQGQGKNGDDVYKSECDENEFQSTRCYVKWIQLTDDYIIHLISLERVAYVLSSEISVLFWEDDVLTCMLKQRRVDIQRRVVGKVDYPELFNDLKNYNVSAVETNDSEEKTFLSLYRLDCVPKILRVFEHDDENLLKSIEELVNKFDPDSPYWKSGNPTTNTTTITCEDKSEDKTEDKSLEQSQDDDIEDFSLEDKQMALQTLQFKRKRVLQTMISDPEKLTDDLVNELNNYEIEIVAIKQQIKNQQNAGKTDTPSLSSKSDQQEDKIPETSPEMSESQRVIQNILDSSTKPIATANIMTQASTSTCSIDPLTQLSQSGSQSSLINNSWMNHAMTGNFPEFYPRSATGSSSNMTQSVTGSGDTGSQSMAESSNVMTQSMTGSGNILSQSTGSFPNFMQQPSGHFPGMLGVHGMPNPRLMNPVLLNQAGFPCTGMGDLTNTMFPRGMGLGAGYQPGLLPQFNPLMMPCQGIGNPNMGVLPRIPLMQNMGRGQTLAQNILPGLLPLVQNLNLGRGSGS